eukprot:scaffold40449_cov18-Prasinocladus_malaysianus.AAC.1
MMSPRQLRRLIASSSRKPSDSNLLAAFHSTIVISGMINHLISTSSRESRPFVDEFRVHVLTALLVSYPYGEISIHKKILLSVDLCLRL